MSEKMSKKDFRSELEKLINRHSKENGSDTPDFILAEYLTGCLENFDKTIRARERWYGREEVAREHYAAPPGSGTTGESVRALRAALGSEPRSGGAS